MNEKSVAERSRFRMDVYIEEWVRASGFRSDAMMAVWSGALFLWVASPYNRGEHA